MAKNTLEQVGVDVPDDDIQLAAPEAEPEQSDRPEWLPDNFDSPEAFASSYREMVQRLSRESEERKQLEEYIEELTTEQEQAPPPQQQQQAGYDPQMDALIAQYETALENFDARTALGIQAYVAQMAAMAAVQQNQPPPQDNSAELQTFAIVAEDQARRQFEQKYPGESWDAIKADVGGWLGDGREHWLQTAQDPVTAANRLVEAADYIRGQQALTGQVQADNQANALQRQKMQAGGIQAAGARTQAAQEAGDALVERMKQVARPYGYSA